jgi:hypothetical protein
MTIEWKVVSVSEHRNSCYTPRAGYRHAASSVVAPLLVAELDNALSHFVIAFARLKEQVVPVAVLGLEENQNLYLNADGKWLGLYVPACFRSEPFKLLQTADEQKVLGIRTDALVTNGQPLFTASGELAVKDVLNFLASCESNRAATHQAATLLDQAGVLEPMVLKVPVPGSPQRVMNGLYKVNEAALNGLDAHSFAELQGDSLKLAYAQVFSMSQVSQLTNRLLHHSKNQPLESVDVESMFSQNNDTLKFDF